MGAKQPTSTLAKRPPATCGKAAITPARSTRRRPALCRAQPGAGGDGFAGSRLPLVQCGRPLRKRAPRCSVGTGASAGCLEPGHVAGVPGIGLRIGVRRDPPQHSHRPSPRYAGFRRRIRKSPPPPPGARQRRPSTHPRVRRAPAVLRVWPALTPRIRPICLNFWTNLNLHGHTLRNSFSRCGSRR